MKYTQKIKPESFAQSQREIPKHKFISDKSITQNSVNVDDSWGWAKYLGNYSPAQFMIFSPNARAPTRWMKLERRQLIKYTQKIKPECFAQSQREIPNANSPTINQLPKILLMWIARGAGRSIWAIIHAHNL
jgi:hypothetical protein